MDACHPPPRWPGLVCPLEEVRQQSLKLTLEAALLSSSHRLEFLGQLCPVDVWVASVPQDFRLAQEPGMKI